MSSPTGTSGALAWWLRKGTTAVHDRRAAPLPGDTTAWLRRRCVTAPSIAVDYPRRRGPDRRRVDNAFLGATVAQYCVALDNVLFWSLSPLADADWAATPQVTAQA